MSGVVTVAADQNVQIVAEDDEGVVTVRSVDVEATIETGQQGPLGPPGPMGPMGPEGPPGLSGTGTGDVPAGRILTAGIGLTGGGDLTVDRVFHVSAGTGLIASTDDIALAVPVAVEHGGTGNTTGISEAMQSALVSRVSKLGDTMVGPLTINHGTNSGTLYFGSGTGTFLYYNGSTGNFNFTHALKVAGYDVWHTGTFTPSNYATLAGASFTGNVAAAGFYPAGGGSFTSNTLSANSVVANSVVSNGNLNVTGTVTAGTANVTGGLSVGSAITATGGISSGSNINVTAGSVISAGGFSTSSYYGDGSYWASAFSSGNPAWGSSVLIRALHIPANWAGIQMAMLSTTFEFRNGGGAYKPGGGSWADNSDERIKTVLGDYESGLDAILALQPVRYTFRGNDTYTLPANAPTGTVLDEAPKETPEVPYKNSPHYGAAVDAKEYIGLVAQQAEATMPEMVTQSIGYIDGAEVTDMRSLDTGPLVFALINAVKELKAEIEQLKAAR